MYGLNILFWNAKGLSKKLKELIEILRIEEIDIACISETHLTNNLTIPDIPNYHVIRHDRAKHLGGLLTIIKDTVSFNERQLGPTSLLEYAAFDIKSQTHFTIINTYLPGGAKTPDIKSKLKKDLDILLDNSRLPVFLVGDLNGKNKLWGCKSNNAAGKIILDKTRNSPIVMSFPEEHTYHPLSIKKSPSTIDIILTNGSLAWSTPYVKQILSSDHLPVFFKIHTDTAGTSSRRVNTRPNFARTNWKAFRDSLNKDLETTAPWLFQKDTLTNEEIDGSIAKLVTATKQALSTNVVNERVNKYGVFHTKEIKDLIKKRDYHRRRWSRTHKLEDKALYTSLNKEIKYMIAGDFRNNLDKKLTKCKVGDNSLYKMIKNRRRTSTLPPLDSKFNPGTQIFSDDDKSSEIADHFAKMHKNPLARSNLVFTVGVNSYAKHLLHGLERHSEIDLITASEVIKQIRLLKPGKSPGPDELPVVAIRNLSHLGIETLTKLLNCSLANGYFPREWKVAKTIPIHKSGKDGRDIASYRPISLINILSKIYEKTIHKRLQNYCQTNSIIPDQQFGFRPGHSTNHAIMHLHNHINSALADKKTTGVLSFDIEKAFDRVWHNGLIYKMHNLKFPMYMIKIVKSFLSDRKFRVCVNGASSSEMDIPWGVPQGSALSPILYNIFTSDFPTQSDPNTKVSLYADDTVIWTSSRIIAKIDKRLTNTSEVIFQYFDKWKIKINKNKTNFACFTNRRTKQIPPQYIILNNEKVERSPTLKYLGVTFDTKLTYKTHIRNTLIKIDNIYRTLYPFICKNSMLPPRTKIHVFNTYMRPVMLYAYPLLAELKASRLLPLQTKQNKCLRQLLSVSWDVFATTSEVHRMANIDMIQTRIDQLRATFIIKCSMSINPIVRDLYIEL